MASIEAKGSPDAKKPRKTPNKSPAAISLQAIFDEEDAQIFENGGEKQEDKAEEEGESSGTESEEDTPAKRKQLEDQVDEFFDS